MNVLILFAFLMLSIYWYVEEGIKLFLGQDDIDVQKYIISFILGLMGMFGLKGNDLDFLMYFFMILYILMCILVCLTNKFKEIENNQDNDNI